MRHACFLPLVLLLALVALPAAAQAAPADRSPIPVIVSIAPQKFILERIAPGAVSVTTLVRPGSDPHAYDPSPGQMRAVATAKVWFTMGVPFEDVWLPRVSANAPGLNIVSMIRDVPRLPFADNEPIGHQRHEHAPGQPRSEQSDIERPGTHAHGRRAPDEVDGHTGHEHGHDHGPEDPHVWLDPLLVRKMLPVVVEALAEILPDGRSRFQANADALAVELEEAGAAAASAFEAIPPERRVFLTFHPSWRYFAHAYGLQELTIEVEGKEPGPRKLQAIVSQARKQGITTVFIEPQFSRAAARAVAQSLGASVVVIDPLEENLLTLYRDVAEKLKRSFVAGGE